MIPQIQINDLFEELTEKNNRLLSQLLLANKCMQLLEKYRNCLRSFDKDCQCDQNTNKNEFKLLESEFDIVFNNETQLNCQLSRETCNINSRKTNELKTNQNEVTKRKSNRSTTYSKRKKVTKSFEGEVNQNESSIAINDTNYEEIDHTNDDSNYDMNGNANKKRNLSKTNQYLIERNGQKQFDREKILEDLRLNKIIEIVDEQNGMISALKPKVNEKSGDSFELAKTIGYRCNWTDCDYINTKRYVSSHIRAKHTNERPFTCDQCDKCYASSKHLSSHKTTIHGKGLSKRLRCQWSQCQYETYNRSVMKNHYMRHTKTKQFKCDVDGCKSSFYSNGEYNAHKNTVHSHLRPHLCEWPGCDAAFKSKQVLESHKATHIRDTIFKCDYPFCQKKFSLKSLLLAHQKTHRMTHTNDQTLDQTNFHINQDIEQDNNSSGQYVVHRRSGALNRQLILEHLKLRKIVETVDPKNNMISALRPKVNVKSDDCFEMGLLIGYRCNWTDCNFVSRRSKVINHIKSKHTNERPFSCDKCDKKFAAKQYLDSHCQYIHGSTQWLKCIWPECQFETYVKSALETHYMRHQNIKPFKCNINGCQTTFCTFGEFNSHKNSVHNHLRPFLCEWPGCGSNFKTKNALQSHQVIHTGDKPFKCDYPNCEARFGLKGSLTTHKKTHDLVKKTCLQLD